MRFQDVAEILKDIPFTDPTRGRIIYDFVRNGRFQNILELGFAHGVSTCYIAAALDENGSGSIITIDKQSAKDRRPDIFTLLHQTGLADYVKPIFVDTSYTWELMKIIEQQTIQGICKTIFDFCYIDGAHTWEVDGLAFFLVEKILKPGGWILFDDLDWTFAESPCNKETEMVQKMPKDEKTTPQVGKIFSLLVCQHQGFENISIHNQWGWAQKKEAPLDETTRTSRSLVDEVYSQQHIMSAVKRLVIDVIEILKKIKRRLPF